MSADNWPPQAAPNWTSRRAPSVDLQDDVKFAELVGTTIANLRQSIRLIVPTSRDAAFLCACRTRSSCRPRSGSGACPKRNGSVRAVLRLARLFEEERGRERPLIELLQRVSDALGVMTHHILANGGVVGDFHGDAAMGFWGWPLEQSEIAARAAEAALRILTASRVGSSQQAISLRNRDCHGVRSRPDRHGRPGQGHGLWSGCELGEPLGGHATKAFGTAIIVDACNRPGNPRRPPLLSNSCRLAKVRPAGMQTPVEVYELLTVTQDKANRLTDHQIQQYEAALDLLIRGNWEQAYERLDSLPSWDRPKDVLLETIEPDQRPPDGWDGVIRDSQSLIAGGT